MCLPLELTMAAELNPEYAEAVAQIKAAGGEAIANFDSVSTPEGGENIIKAAVAKWGRVDVVINNAGGASALEALACGLPTLIADPVPGHGRANARRMEEAGLATVCPTPGDLAREVHRLAVDAAHREALRRAAGRYAADRDLGADLRHAVDPLLTASSTTRAPAPTQP
jgi:UDP-N-acetylglucosamine:LPS N-acetylglucosamine transferase